MKKKIISIVILLLLITSAAYAELKGENLLHGLPDGYKVGHQSRNGNNLIVEMVPKNETVHNWTEMLTTNITFGNLAVTPVKYSELMKAMWKKSCPGSGGSLITSGAENGYPFAVWMLVCPNNPSSGKPEWTWFKAIKGNDSFYVVQKAWRSEPPQEDVSNWMKHFRKIQVCDTRIPARKCPSFK
jgi:hypothetical protein